MSLVNVKAAWLVKDIEAAYILVDNAIKLADDKSEMQQLSQNIKTLAKPNAGKEIAAEVLKIINR
jgi:UDP-N-acetylglucosamine--N-acetylmuramyl-(pentapeptide) pyrophosphoryl-undecaprenol N-acetylglucosamine transferase